MIRPVFVLIMVLAISFQITGQETMVNGFTYDKETNEPYAEIGIGAENILRFFRLDAVWRLTKTGVAPNFGLRARMEIKI